MELITVLIMLVKKDYQILIKKAKENKEETDKKYNK